MNSFITYLKNVRSELTHVVWPSQEQTVQHVALVVLISIIAAIFIAALDYVFTTGVGQFIY